MNREMSVAGSFYPQRATDLDRYFEHFNKVYDENFSLPNIKSRAIIVPHAGYVYSGYSANIAYRILHTSTAKNFVVIGPSHRVAFDGISLCEDENYETPFGNIESSSSIVDKLKDRFNLKTILNLHAEHSTEVQFPFIKHYLPDAKIVELVYGRVQPSTLSEIIDFVLSSEDCGVIISTDLSHFHALKDANIIDNICLNAIDYLDIKTLHNGCEACGIIGVEAILRSAKKLALKPTILDYRTSADASNDTNRVVGYVSACFE
ncbi:MAG: AmmeMemoRadiSam system protein B [Campylobacterota bacterium]|nr:AmmeMemoRadiSam system protein B [Campylobacterota bacterium]